MKKVLWLASWYPNEKDPFSGDFIQRQAEAVSLYQPLIVIYVGKESSGSVQNASNKIRNISENLQEHLVYYSGGQGLLSKWKSLNIYFLKHLRIIKDLKKTNNLPHLVHVHVAMKAGLVALYMKWKYKIPYVLTEHWSGYYRQSGDSLFRKTFAERYLTKLILKHTSRLLPVSQALGIQINQYWADVSFQKIPNVVNTGFFYPDRNKKPHPFRFIHVSSLLYPKNPEGIINTFIHLLRSGVDAELILVGPLNPSVKKLLDNDILSTGRFRTTGEISYEQVGSELRNADGLVLFSFYENMPCVMLEALCTGIPVIATEVGGIHEEINSDNGILIEAGREEKLLEAMIRMIANYESYDSAKISSQATEKFSYETIGKKIVDIYADVLKK